MDHAQLVRDTWAALTQGDLSAVEAVLAPDARWHAVEDGPWNCESREQIISVMAERRGVGFMAGQIEDVVDVDGERVIVAFRPDHEPDEWPLDNGIRYVVISFDGDRVSEIKGCRDRQVAHAYAAGA